MVVEQVLEEVAQAFLVLEQVLVLVLVGKILLYRRQNRQNRQNCRPCRETIHLSGFLFLGLSLLIVCSIVLLELLTFLTAQNLDWVVVVLVVVETVAVLVVLQALLVCPAAVVLGSVLVMLVL